MTNNERGSILIFTLGVLGLLVALAGLLNTPTQLEGRWLDRHDAQVRAQYLSLAGVERARAWASTGVVSNQVYALGDGTVSLTMSRGADQTCRVRSLGQLPRGGSKQPMTVQTEVTISLP